MEADLKIYESVASTNITLKELADNGAREGVCVVAFSQSAGQGRSGRTFFSPEGGNLYMSLLLRPHDDEVFDMITTMAAVAVCDSIKELFNIDTGIKWVNDIILDGRKVCGIVAQAHNYGKKDRYVILGIGINIYEAADIPDDISDIYASLKGRACDLEKDDAKKQAVRLANMIIEKFSEFYAADDIYGHIDEYRKRCIFIEKDICYVSGDTLFYAKCTGIDDRGGIMLDVDGDIRVFRDGEIRIKPTDK